MRSRSVRSGMTSSSAAAPSTPSHSSARSKRSMAKRGSRVFARTRINVSRGNARAANGISSIGSSTSGASMCGAAAVDRRVGPIVAIGTPTSAAIVAAVSIPAPNTQTRNGRSPMLRTDAGRQRPIHRPPAAPSRRTDTHEPSSATTRTRETGRMETPADPKRRLSLIRRNSCRAAALSGCARTALVSPRATWPE